MLRLYHAGRYAAALELIDGEGEPFPEALPDRYWARLCLLSRLGEWDRARSAFAEALNRGL